MDRIGDTSAADDAYLYVTDLSRLRKSSIACAAIKTIWVGSIGSTILADFRSRRFQATYLSDVVGVATYSLFGYCDVVFESKVLLVVER